LPINIYLFMKKTTLLFFAIFTLITSQRAAAQDYKLAAGLKFAYEYGPSVKYFYQSDAAIEAVIGFRSRGAVLTGLWEKHVAAFNVDKLKFYYGFGAHVGGIGAGTYRRGGFGTGDLVYSDSSLLLGADGVVGLEYVIPNAPIGISLDLNPRLEVARGPFFDLSPGIGVKYTF
jgi:hypothetical protein